MQRHPILLAGTLGLALLAGCSQSTAPTGSEAATTEPVSSTPAAGQPAAPAEGILADHIRAMGGAEAVARIKTLHRSGQVSGSSAGFALSGTYEETVDLAQDRGYTSMDMIGYFRREGWSGEVGWTQDTQSGVVDTAAEQLMMTKLEFQPAPLVALVAERGAGALKETGEREFNGQQCVVVTAEGSPVEFYLNQETKLIEGIALPGTIDVTFADYQAVEGVPLAGKRTVQISQPATTVTFVVEATELNGQIDVARFGKPSGEAAQVATAGETQPTGDAQGTGGVTAEQVVQAMDANRDGKITKDEASEDLKLFFGEIDTNGDGGIDVQEAQVMVKDMQDQPTTAQPSATPPQGEMTAAQLIGFMDKNGDGKIAKDEANEQLKPFFDQQDQNKDGFLDAAEAQTLADIINGQQADSQQGEQKPAPPQGSMTATQLISFMDKNGDGKIAKDEANDQLKPAFGQFDQNKDGFLDAAEAQALVDIINRQQADSQQGAQKPTPPQAAMTAERVMAAMDKNGDGKIAKDEASAQVKLFFGHLDQNQDGFIDLEEAQVIAQYSQGQQVEPDGEKIFRAMDRDGDEKVTRAEASAGIKENFQFFDTNGDGVIVLAEMKVAIAASKKQQSGSQKAAPPKGAQKSAAPKEGLTGAQLISFMDKNGDGKIAKDEANEQLKPFFDQQDQNKDGFIDAVEAQTIADFVNSQQSE